jgi:peptidoglycan/LPS O-acetylase OafA/YrhL
MTETSRHGNFDFIRLTAAFMVLIGHAFIIMGKQSPTFLGIEISVFGVMIFFSISGYLVSESWIRDPSVMRYMARRSLRIFPALVAVILLSTFLLGPVFTTLSHHDYFTNRQTYTYLENIFLVTQRSLPEVFKNNPQSLRVNDSLWTLPIELLMYLFLPVLTFLHGQKNALIFAALTIFISLIFTFYLPTIGGGEITQNSSIYLVELIIFEVAKVSMFFMAGVFIRYVFMTLKPPLVLATSLFFSTIGMYYLADINLYLLYVSLAFSLPFFINALGESPKVRLPSLNRVGDLSYGIYLYAFPIQQIIAHFFIGKISVFTAIVIAVIPTACFAYVSWHLLEKKALILKTKLQIG